MGAKITMDAENGAGEPVVQCVQEDHRRVAAEVAGGSTRQYTDMTGREVWVNLKRVLFVHEYDPDAGE